MAEALASSVVLPLTCVAASCPRHRSASALPRRPEGELLPQHRNYKDRQRGNRGTETK